MSMKARITTMLALLIIAVTSAWAQDEVTVAPTANANEWTLEMPDADVELEVTYYTDEELAAMEEAAFTAGVELTKASNGEWTLAEMPGFDIELEVEYETDLALNEVDDNTAALAEWNGYEADVTLTRTLQTGSYNTFALPFSAAIPTGWTVKELSSATLEGQTLTLNFQDATSIEAGKPYLVKVTDAAVNPPFDGVIISKDAVPYTSTNVDFIPTLGATTITGDDAKTVLFLAAGNKLKNPTFLPTDMKGFRAYFQLKGAAAGARNFDLNIDGDVTGVNEVIGVNEVNDDSWYTLDSRKLSGKPAQKGVYIVNGKKVIIK